MAWRSWQSTHAQKLERWIGPECMAQISQGMEPWYGPPIAIHGVPGAVYAHKGGDFVGPLRGGGFASLGDFALDRLKRIERNVRERQLRQMNTGFSSLSDLLSEATSGGKQQDWWYSKLGAITTLGAAASLWGVGFNPGIGATPSARPGGSVPTNATVGAIPIVNPGGSDTLHMTTAIGFGSTAPNTLMMYDRTYHAATFNHTSGSQSNTGTPTRYATTTAPGVFAFLEVTTALNATAHTVTMTYTDQAGNTAEAATALSVSASSAIGRVPLGSAAPFLWFIPLNAGDTGIRTVTNLTFSQSGVATGISSLVMGKPLAWIPQPVASAAVVMDGINAAFNFVQVLADACLAFIEHKGVASASMYTGTSIYVAG